VSNQQQYLALLQALLTLMLDQRVTLACRCVAAWMGGGGSDGCLHHGAVLSPLALCCSVVVVLKRGGGGSLRFSIHEKGVAR
jgi:hypothetical protein